MRDRDGSMDSRARATPEQMQRQHVFVMNGSWTAARGRDRRQSMMTPIRELAVRLKGRANTALYDYCWHAACTLCEPTSPRVEETSWLDC
jgi:hypothetical protein